MASLEIGDKAPGFSLPSDGGGKVSLKDYKGQTLILYFYPKDNTPSCTTQALDFTGALAKFKRAGAAIMGVSKDSVAAHDKFVAKHALKIPLGSDEEGTMLEAYGVWKEKSLYGRKFMGIERSTFLIDSKGVIRKIWPKVKVKGHVDEVLQAVKEL